ncbi:MAG: hypothetical protein AB1938_32680 [Myxococcota bacterium]
MTRPLLVAALLLSGATGEWGAPCRATKDCAKGFSCEPHEGQRLCTKSCRQGHAKADCPGGWVCQPWPYDAREGTCLPRREGR